MTNRVILELLHRGALKYDGESLTLESRYLEGDVNVQIMLVDAFTEAFNTPARLASGCAGIVYVTQPLMAIIDELRKKFPVNPGARQVYVADSFSDALLLQIRRAAQSRTPIDDIIALVDGPKRDEIYCAACESLGSHGLREPHCEALLTAERVANAIRAEGH